jgi:hypothetical protein
MSMLQTLDRKSTESQGWQCASSADFERISEDLHSFGDLELRRQLPAHRLIAITPSYDRQRFNKCAVLN